MKKILLLAVVVLCVSLVACGNKEEKKDDANATQVAKKEEVKPVKEEKKEEAKPEKKVNQEESPEMVASRFLWALERGKSNIASQFCVSSNPQMSFELNVISEEYIRYDAKLRLGSLVVNGDRANGHYVNIINGRATPCKMSMVKVGGKWKVDLDKFE